jgi:hypothetical protein
MAGVKIDFVFTFLGGGGQIVRFGKLTPTQSNSSRDDPEYCEKTVSRVLLIDTHTFKYLKNVRATNGCGHLATAVAAAGVGSETL